MVFLPRHGKGHKLNPSEVNYRANIFGMKMLGVSWIVAVTAVGSLEEAIPPGDMVIIDSFIDRTQHVSDLYMLVYFLVQLFSLHIHSAPAYIL